MNRPKQPGNRGQLPFVQARSNGRWRGWAMVGGRRVYGPSRGTDGEAHRDAMNLRSGELSTPATTRTIGQAADAMHAELVGLRRPGTIDFYRQQAAAVFRFIDRDLPLARLTPAVLQELVRLAQEGGFAARTIQHYRRWLNRLIGWCQRPPRAWFTGENPIPMATWPKPRPDAPRVLDEADIAAKLEQLREAPADYDLVLFLAYSGLRRAELARLRGDDFDFARSAFVVRGKTADELAPITEPILQASRNLVARAAENGTGFVVAGDDERRRVQTIDRLFRTWAARFDDRRFHPHALRHSLATNLVRAGVPAGSVQRMLRHSSYATTQSYVHLAAADLHAATGRLRYVSLDQAAEVAATRHMD